MARSLNNLYHGVKLERHHDESPPLNNYESDSLSDYIVLILIISTSAAGEMLINSSHKSKIKASPSYKQYKLDKFETLSGCCNINCYKLCQSELEFCRRSIASETAASAAGLQTD